MNKFFRQTAYRITQFKRSLFPQVDEAAFARFKIYLTSEQPEVFMSLSTADQAHSIQVALICEQLYAQVRGRETKIPALADGDTQHHDPEKTLLMQAALLHDIGKSEARLNAFTRTLFVLLERMQQGICSELQADNWPSILKPLIKGLTTIAWHPQLGAVLAKSYAWHPTLIGLIENHHVEDKMQSTIARILYEADNLC